MTAIGPWGFEGQTNGVVPTPANSSTFGDPAFTSVSASGFITYSTAQARYGSCSLLWNVTTAATAAIADRLDTAASQAAVHTWVYPTAHPTAEIQAPITFRSASLAANQARVQWTATGQLRNVFVTGGTGTASTGTLPLNTWSRIETVITGATGVASAAALTTNVYDASGALLFAVPSLSGGTAANIDTIRWGKAGGTSNVSFHLDDMVQNIGLGTEIGQPAQTISPSGLATIESWGLPLVTPGPASVLLAGLASGEAFGGSTVTTGPVSVLPTGLATAEALGSATVGRGPVAVTPSGLTSGEGWGAPKVTSNVVTNGLPSGEAVGSATVTRGAVTVAPSGWSDVTAVTSPAVSVGSYVQDSFTTGSGMTPDLSKWTVRNNMLGTNHIISGGFDQISLSAVGSYMDRTDLCANAGAAGRTRIICTLIPRQVTEYSFYIIARAAANTDLRNNSYQAVVSQDGIAVIKRIAGVTTSLLAVQAISGVGASVPVHVDFEVNAGSMTLYCWTGPTRPTSPTWTGTDSSISAPGFAGFSLIGGSAAVAGKQVDLDEAAITTGASSQDVVPTGLASGEAHGTGLISTGPVTVAPAGIGSAAALGTATVGSVVAPAGLGSAAAVGAPTVLQSQSVTPTGLASGEAFGTAAVSATLSGQGIASAEAVGAATVSPGAANVAPLGTGSGESWGQPFIGSGVNITPAVILTSEQFGTSLVSTGPVTTSPASIASGEAFGTPTVGRGPVSVVAVGLLSAEAWGTPALATGTASVGPAPLATAETWGTPGVTPGQVAVAVTVGLLSGEQFGNASVTAGPINVAPPSIASVGAFGGGRIASNVTGTGITSREAFGTTLVLAEQELKPTGIPTGLAWGQPTVLLGADPDGRDVDLAGILAEQGRLRTILAEQGRFDPLLAEQGRITAGLREQSG